MTTPLTIMVFESFPILQGKYLSYAEYFMLIGSGGSLILSAGFFFLGVLVLFLLSPTFRAKHPTIWNYLPMQGEGENEGVRVVYELCAWVSALFLSFALIIFSMFDWVPPAATMLSSLLILSLRLRSWCANTSLLHPSPGLSYLSETKRLLQTKEQQNPLFLYGLIGLVLVYSLGLPLVSFGTCICFYNPGIGLGLPGQASLSTWLLRYMTLEDACPPGAPCYVYLTLPEDSSHYIFVNAHTSPQQSSLLLHYGPTPTDLNSTLSMTPFPLQGLEKRAARTVHSVLLTGLDSNTAYYFSIEYEAGRWTTPQWFQTLPEYWDDVPVTVISGGDAGNTPQAYTMSQRAGEQNPAVAFVGGDVAYDDNMLSCYQAWDLFLAQWDKYLTSASGRLVPMVLTVGNHDVGMDSMAGRNVTLGPEGPLFFAYFPQHFGRDGEGNVVYQVPSLESRRSYFYHHLGKAVMLSLDTAYIADMTGTQLTWLRQTLATLAPLYPVRFVTYHNPLYPSSPCTDVSAIPPAIGIRYWVPLFDEYSVMVAFENHVHSFKRTNPLICSLDSPSGTVYVGDGQWGANPTLGPWDTDPEIFLKEGIQYHVWRIDISSSSVNFTAIGLQPGQVVDSFTREY